MADHIINVFRELADMAYRQDNMTHKNCFGAIKQNYTAWEPNTDIIESETEVLIRLELAGVEKDDISVKVKEGKLFITGIRKNIKPEHEVYFHQMEIHCGEFCKVIVLPENLEHNDMSARFLEGLLEIKISKNSEIVEIPIAIETSIKI